LTAIAKVISADHVQAAVDAILGLDASQAPTDPAELAERLTSPQPGVTEAMELVFSQKASKHATKAVPLVYVALEAATRAFPEEMKSEIKSKPFVTALASATGEALIAAKTPGKMDGATAERQPELVNYMNRFLSAQGDYMGKLSIEDRAGVYALALGAIRAVDKQIQGPEKPATAVHEPGRNDPCFCGSGKKFKKCHDLIDRSKWPAP
jgi:hypothetical protein